MSGRSIAISPATSSAAELFAAAAGLRPGDLGAAMMRDRAFALANDPPPNWDGVHVMEEK
jgi:hypothetical protein